MRTLRAVTNARRTLRAGFTTVRNLGLFIQTGGLLLDVALKKAIDLGWIDGPHVVPAGHAITPTGGHLDPTMFQALAPHIMPLTVEEGIANGVSEVRKAVRYQIKHGAELIKVCASGGVMSHTGPAGAQQYSNDELRRDRRRGAPGRPPGRRACARRPGHPRRHRGRDRLHRARVAHVRRDARPAHRDGDVPRADDLPGRRHGRLPSRPRASGQGGRGVPESQGDHPQGGRQGRRDRLWNGRPGHPPRPEREGAASRWSIAA